VIRRRVYQKKKTGEGKGDNQSSDDRENRMRGMGTVRAEKRVLQKRIRKRRVLSEIGKKGGGKTGRVFFELVGCGKRRSRGTGIVVWSEGFQGRKGQEGKGSAWGFSSRYLGSSSSWTQSEGRAAGPSLDKGERNRFVSTPSPAEGRQQGGKEGLTGESHCKAVEGSQLEQEKGREAHGLTIPRKKPRKGADLEGGFSSQPKKEGKKPVMRSRQRYGEKGAHIEQETQGNRKSGKAG